MGTKPNFWESEKQRRPKIRCHISRDFGMEIRMEKGMFRPSLSQLLGPAPLTTKHGEVYSPLGQSQQVTETSEQTDD